MRQFIYDLTESCLHHKTTMYSALLSSSALTRLLQCGFALIGIYWLQGKDSSPALSWMNIYMPEDFVNYSWLEVFNFISNTRLPLPPHISFAEIASQKLFGSTEIVTKTFYKISFIGAYLIILEMARNHLRRFLVTWVVSSLFLFCAINIHQGNPQGYDVFLPFFVLLFVYFLNKSIATQRRRYRNISALLAGIFLGCAELTRPFMIYLLPVVSGLVLLRLWRLPHAPRYQCAMFFLIPVLLLSGTVHLNIWFKHHQLTFSNNTGYNLSRAWGRLIIVPELLTEPTSSQAPGRWPDLDTNEHKINSDRFQRAVIQQWITHPIQSASFALSLINEFLTGETRIYSHDPNSIFIQAYKLIYKLLASLLIINLMVLVYLKLFHSTDRVVDLTETDNLIIWLTGCLIVLMAIGEKGEEARFVISILPLIAFVPLARTVSRSVTHLKSFAAVDQIRFHW